MSIISSKINIETLEKIISKYKDYQKDNSNEYIVFFANVDNNQISVFKNNKDSSYKVVFNGNNASKLAKEFDIEEEIKIDTFKAREAKEWICLATQIGSDEVGTGDFFGPICVCAAYVKSSDIEFLKELGVNDSKKLSDDEIREIAPILISKIEYSQVSVDNEKFNECISKSMNMNEIKAKLHNQVLLNLKKKHPSCNNIFLDEFLSEENYYKYLKDSKEILTGITFRMKGESAYPSVAVGSIIARYSFLTKLDKLNEKYNVNIPHGASNKVDEFAKEFLNKFGLEELNKIIKINFANYKKITL